MNNIKSAVIIVFCLLVADYSYGKLEISYTPNDSSMILGFTNTHTEEITLTVFDKNHGKPESHCLLKNEKIGANEVYEIELEPKKLPEEINFFLALYSVGGDGKEIFEPIGIPRLTPELTPDLPIQPVCIGDYYDDGRVCKRLGGYSFSLDCDEDDVTYCLIDTLSDSCRMIDGAGYETERYCFRIKKELLDCDEDDVTYCLIDTLSDSCRMIDGAGYETERYCFRIKKELLDCDAVEGPNRIDQYPPIMEGYLFNWKIPCMKTFIVREDLAIESRKAIPSFSKSVTGVDTKELIKRALLGVSSYGLRLGVEYFVEQAHSKDNELLSSSSSSAQSLLLNPVPEEASLQTTTISTRSDRIRERAYYNHRSEKHLDSSNCETPDYYYAESELVAQGEILPLREALPPSTLSSGASGIGDS